MSSIAVRVPTVLPENNLHMQRAMAVLAVVVCHFTLTWITPAWAHILGQAAVGVFFLHTCVVLRKSIERMGADEREVRSWVPEFVLKRFFRLFPLAVVVILMFVIGNFPENTMIGLKEVSDPTLQAVVANMTLFQNVLGIPNIYVVLWTLPLEWQMYLVLPLCYLMQRRGAKWLVGLVLLTFLGGLVSVWSGKGIIEVPFIWRLSLLAYAPCFVAGLIAFHFLQVRAWKPFLPAWSWPLALIGWTFFYAAWGSPSNPYLRWVYCFGLAMMLPSFRDFDLETAGRFTHRLFRLAKVVAERSYSTYLFNMMAIAIVWRGREQTGAFIVLVLAALFLFKSGRVNAMVLASFGFFAVLWLRTPKATFDLVSVAEFAGVLILLVIGGYDFVEVPGMRLASLIRQQRGKRKRSLVAVVSPP